MQNFIVASRGCCKFPRPMYSYILMSGAAKMTLRILLMKLLPQRKNDLGSL